VAKIEWSANGGFGGAPAEWLVPAAARSATAGTGPWAVVRAYFQDITLRDYAAAWRLLGHHPRGAGYASFDPALEGKYRFRVTHPVDDQQPRPIPCRLSNDSVDERVPACGDQLIPQLLKNSSV
jgi:hypothetical protein